MTQPARLLPVLAVAFAFVFFAAGPSEAKKPSPLNKPAKSVAAGKGAAKSKKAVKQAAAPQKKEKEKEKEKDKDKANKGKESKKTAVAKTAPQKKVLAIKSKLAKADLTPAPPPPPPKPAKPIETAIAKAKSGDDQDAHAAAAQVADPAARSLVEWILIRTGAIDRDHRRILAFAERHPHWPSMPLVRRRAETALLRSSPSPEAVFAFFTSQNPVSVEGRIAWAKAYRARGDSGRAGELIRSVWTQEPLSEAGETDILAAFPDEFQIFHHKERYANLLFQSEIEAGLRAAGRVGGDDLALAKAWAAHLRREKDAPSQLDAVPDTMKSHPGFLLSLLQHLRRDKDRLKDALIVLQHMPQDPAQLGSPDKWWEERRAIAKRLMEENDPKGAYQAASGPPPSSLAERLEADSMAGWIALRMLKEPALAKPHFERMRHDAGTPISKARAFYWLARAEEALGAADMAAFNYGKAAEHGTTFYGQLALSKTGGRRLNLPAVPEPTAEERAAFAASDLARAVRLLDEAGDKAFALSFASLVCDLLDEPAQLAMLSELAAEIGGPRHVVLLGKKMIQRAPPKAELSDVIKALRPLQALAFPTTALPSYSIVGREIDPALVYAIARQESLFDSDAVSPVGARGLMQLMPATARMMAKNHNVAFSLEKLTKDPAYNLQLGSAFLADLVNRYRGSYIMAFAAYNAGPGRVQDWVAKYGDPRAPDVDPVDWVERIPFNETRNYVQRVMENMQVYRARFDAEAVLDMERDLKQGDVTKASSAPSPPPAVAETALQTQAEAANVEP